MKKADVAISPTRGAPTTGIKRVIPQVDCNLKKCEATLNIGIFFDGTNNNKTIDSANHSDSNVARLHDAYSNGLPSEYSKLYVPGVGTSFPEIGEYGNNKAGAGCAFGCEARVIFALLSIFNFIHRASLKEGMFDKDSMLALCRNNGNVPDDEDQKMLSGLGLQCGLLQPELGSSSVRKQFLKRQAKILEAKVKSSKPRVVEIFVDVFGFSRGAAEARVFCNWLDELLIGNSFAGVPLHFRFVGIIDTVASAGFWSGTKALLTNSTGGHGDWANAESLQLPAPVRNCVHMIAMHELRRNFPLDEIGINGRLKSGWVQLAYPGAHSDVGGGYKPGELGIATGDDSMKLSQIPLNHMLACALSAGVPLNKPVPKPGVSDPFSIHPTLAKAYDSFVCEATLAPRPVHEWLQTYLNWRWQVRESFRNTSQVKQATPEERSILLKFNDSLISDAASMMRSASKSVIQRIAAAFDDPYYIGSRRDLFVTPALEPEAREVLSIAQHAAPTPAAFASLFDGYVHDSLAGFNSPNLELTGYWRYRRVFLGNDESVLAMNQDVTATQKLA